MYVCICNGIRETDLRACAREVPGDAEQVYHELGFTPQCRMCLDEAEGILADARRPSRELLIV